MKVSFVILTGIVAGLLCWYVYIHLFILPIEPVVPPKHITFINVTFHKRGEEISPFFNVTVYAMNTGGPGAEIDIYDLRINGESHKFYVVYGDLSDKWQVGEIVGLGVRLQWLPRKKYTFTLITQEGASWSKTVNAPSNQGL